MTNIRHLSLLCLHLIYVYLFNFFNNAGSSSDYNASNGMVSDEK